MVPRGVQPWDDKNAMLAAREFEVPEGTKVVTVWPDLFDRDILEKEEAYARSYKVNGMTKKGVLTKCVYCDSNEHIKMDGFTAHKDTMRSAADVEADRVLINSPIYACHNQQCCGGVENPDSSDYLSKHTFRIYVKEVWEAYPQSVRDRYKAFLHTSITDGSNNQMFVTEEFCADVLSDRTLFSQLEEEYEEKHRRRKRRAMESYNEFVKLQFKNNSHGVLSDEFYSLWPKFGSERFDRDFSPPKEGKIKSVFKKGYGLIEHHLYRDLFNRLPGRIVKWDGTFQFAMKTNDDAESEEETKVLLILYGEFGHIISFAIATSENLTNYQRMQYFLRERCARVGGQEAVNAVKVGYSDVCCEELTNTLDHWHIKLWPGVTMAPRKDMFHAESLITRQTRGAAHELHSPFVQAIKATCLKFEQKSQLQIAEKYINDKKLNLIPEAAVQDMMKEKSYRDRIYNFVPKSKNCITEMRAAFEKILGEDRALKEAAHENKFGYKSYVLKPIAGVRKGTAKAVDNFCHHAEKGCYLDPFPIYDMSKPLDPSELHSKLLRVRGTSAGESANKQCNKLVQDVGSQGADIGHMKLMLRTHRFNLQKDKKCSKLFAITPREIEWYLHEELSKNLFDDYDSVEFPPDLLEEHYEPVGIYFGRYKEWERVQKNIDLLLQGSNVATLSSPATASVPTAVLTAVTAIVPITATSPESTSSPATSVQDAATESSLATLAQVGTSSPATTLRPVLPSSPTATSSSERPPWMQIHGVPDFGNPGVNWTRKLGGITSVSVLNRYLSERIELTLDQRKLFFGIVQEVHVMNGNDSDAIIAEEISRVWNARHLRSLGERSIGYGGQIKTGHVKKVLKTVGQEIQQAKLGITPRQFAPPPFGQHSMQRAHFGFAQQIQQANQPAIRMTASSFPYQSQQLERKRPRTKKPIKVTKESIKRLKWSHAVEAARVLKIRQGKTLDQKKDDLQKKFEQMPEDFELSIDV
jgi:hypothetical protein